MESQWLELLFQCIFRLSFHLHDLAIPTIIGHIIGRIAADGLIDGFCYLFLIDTKKLLSVIGNLILGPAVIVDI